MGSGWGVLARQALFVLIFLVILGLALALRLDELGLKPLHNDESVNGWFTLRLQWWNTYRYQPPDHHGPLLYYITWVFFELLGPSELSLRLGTALAGALVLLALLPLRRFLGGFGLLVASALLAVSPAQVFFGRTAIHEVYLVLLSVVLFAASARFVERPKPRFAHWAALAGALALATKETAVLTFASLGLGLLVAWQFGRQLPGHRGCVEPDLFFGRKRRDALKAVLEGGWPLALRVLAPAALVLVLLFSSFFSYTEGVPKFFQAFGSWVEYGVGSRGQTKDVLYFANYFQETLGWTLLPVLLAGLWALLTRHRFALVLVGWATSSFLIYSIIPYKTPWCALNIELPVLLLCGWGAQQALLAAQDIGLHPAKRAAAVALAVLPIATAGPLVGESWYVNQMAFDDRSHPYVYSQTLRGFHGLTRDLLGVGDSLPVTERLGPRVLNVDAKHPTRWYTITRGWDHSRTRYTERVPKVEWIREAEVVLASGGRTRSVEDSLRRAGGSWHQEVYPLRPGWRITAWFRQELWEAYQDRGGRLVSPWPRPPVSAIHVPERP